MAKYRDQDNVVGTATRYGLEGPVFELLWEQRFSSLHTIPDWTCGPVNLLYKGYRGSSLVVKRPGLCVVHPLPFSVENKNR